MAIRGYIFLQQSLYSKTKLKQYEAAIAAASALEILKQYKFNDVLPCVSSIVLDFAEDNIDNIDTI